MHAHVSVVRAASAEVAARQVPQLFRDAAAWPMLVPANSGSSSSTGSSGSTAVILVPLSPPATPSPDVVEGLVDLLSARGWTRIVVAGATSRFDRDRGLTDAVELARRAGYSGFTTRLSPYEVLDLRADPEWPGQLTGDEGSVLFDRSVSGTWTNSGLRVVLARSVSDAVDGFRGCLSALAAVAEEIPAVSVADVAAAVLADLPPHLAVIDATVSSHGPSGSTRLVPLDTATLVASDDALVADFVLARLHGVDISASRFVHASLTQRSLPDDLTIDGDTTPFEGWRAPDQRVSSALRRLEDESATAARIMAVIGSSSDVASEDQFLGFLHRTVGGLLSPAGPAQGLPAVTLSHVLASAADYVRGLRSVFDKSKVSRVDVALGFDPAALDPESFDDISTYVSSFDAPLAEVPAEDGLQWCHLSDGSVLFRATRTVPASFDDWVARVDISQGLRLMADHLGGRAAPLAHDSDGRIIRQAERNVFLPRPNYLALWGGAEVDTCKIETIFYEPGLYELQWRTISSPNGSATIDDGSLTFADAGEGQTTITLTGRQLLALPTLLRAADLDRHPQLMQPFAADTYRRFASGTFDNLEACFEGRPFAIGADPADPYEALPTAAVATAIGMARDWVTEVPLDRRLRGLLAWRPR